MVFKNIFIVMSLSGTMVFILYLLICSLPKQCFSLAWRYRILKIAMMFFLIPFPFFKYYVWGFFYDHFSFIRETVRQYEASVTNIDYIIVVNRDSIRLSSRVQWICLGVLFAAVIASFLIWKQITQYRKMKQICSADPEESTEGKLQEIFYKKKAALHVNGNVKLICSEYFESPVTIGVLSPIILFPVQDKDSRMGDELCEYMIVHELVHIKHHDVLIKLTALLVMAIHWFNPFVYLLVDEISCISDHGCFYLRGRKYYGICIRSADYDYK